MPDRRHALERRDRVDQLALEWHEAVARLDARYRRVAWVVIATLIVGIVAFGAGAVAFYSTQDAIQAGRRGAIGVTCAATSAVIEAGRATITGGGGVKPGSELERNLRQLGYPPRKVRQAAARRAAANYAQLIATRIEQQSGVTHIVRPDGTLDCDRVARVARVSK